jgi:hypothetical protein
MGKKFGGIYGFSIATVFANFFSRKKKSFRE